MSVALEIIYDGTAENLDAFMDYYIKHHMEIVKTFPKIKAIEVDKVVEGDMFVLARLIFDNMDDLKAASESPERKKAMEDMVNFPPYEGKVRRQVVEQIKVL